MSLMIYAVFAGVDGPDILLATAEELGDVRSPGMQVGIQFSDDTDAMVWIYLRPGPEPVPDPEDDARCEQLLGAPVAADAALHISRSPGSKELALRLIQETAARTPTIVDDGYGWISTVDDLLAYAATSPPDLFFGPPKHPLLVAFADVEAAGRFVRLLRQAADPEGGGVGLASAAADVHRGGLLRRGIRFVDVGEATPGRDLDPAASARYGQVLGVPQPVVMTLALGKDPGSERTALDLLLATDARAIVDDRGRLMTVDEVAAYAATGPPHLFGPRPTPS